MHLTNETKLFIGIGIATVALIVGAIVIFSKQEQAAQNPTIYTKEELIAEHTPTKGNASASAYLVEFSDFQCPACAMYAPFIKQIEQKFGDKLLIGYRFYPLPQHTFAESAAKAAIAAQKQGKFWDMHDELFTNQNSLSDEFVQTAIQKLNLNKEEFMSVYTDPNTLGTVKLDQLAGNKFTVNATPTFFLNGKKLMVRSPQELIQTIERTLQE